MEYLFFYRYNKYFGNCLKSLIQKMNGNFYMGLKKTSLFCILGLSLLSSCATVMHGTHQSIGVSTNPPNAFVWVDSIPMGPTPIIVSLSRKNNHIIHIELEGYQPYEAVLTKQLSGWVFGNIVFGGIIGFAVDIVSGGIYRLTPEQIQAEMLSNNVANAKKSTDSFIAIVLEPKTSWEKIGNLNVIN